VIVTIRVYTWHMTQIQITLILPPPRSTRLYYPRPPTTSALTFHLPTYFKLIPDMNKTQSTSRLSSGAKTLGHETTPVSKPSSGAPNQVTHMPFVIDPGTPGDVSKATKVLSKPISLPHGFGGDTSSPSSSFHFKGPSL